MVGPVDSNPADAYPTEPATRTRWILARRGPREPVDARRPYAFFREPERAEDGQIVQVATIFLTNRECPWRCLMCDLWKHTLPEPVPPGAIPEQIDHALARLRNQAGAPPLRHLKLYNAGSFFDPKAIPPVDHAAIAARGAGFERVIVECHPALVGEPAVRFRDLLAAHAARSIRPPPAFPKLEVALGLETVHPQILPRLNKQMSLGRFARAVDYLRRHHIPVRAFVLVKPPFLVDETSALHWASRSVEFAFDCGASVVSLIPTRGGNGALEALAARGEFAPPRLATLEAALEHGLSLGRGRVFADLWDLENLADCRACLPRRVARLREMNLNQRAPPSVSCQRCERRLGKLTALK